jgi:hypothetical protein
MWWKPEQALRDIGEAVFELTAEYLPLQSDCAPLVQSNQVKCVLAEVDPDRGVGFRRLLGCASHAPRALRNASSRSPDRLAMGAAGQPIVDRCYPQDIQLMSKHRVSA